MKEYYDENRFFLLVASLVLPAAAAVYLLKELAAMFSHTKMMVVFFGSVYFTVYSFYSGVVIQLTYLMDRRQGLFMAACYLLCLCGVCFFINMSPEFWVAQAGMALLGGVFYRIYEGFFVKNFLKERQRIFFRELSRKALLSPKRFESDMVLLLPASRDLRELGRCLSQILSFSLLNPRQLDGFLSLSDILKLLFRYRAVLLNASDVEAELFAIGFLCKPDEFQSAERQLPEETLAGIQLVLKTLESIGFDDERYFNPGMERSVFKLMRRACVAD
jgi:hypothetical protein